MGLTRICRLNKRLCLGKNLSNQNGFFNTSNELHNKTKYATSNIFGQE